MAESRAGSTSIKPLLLHMLERTHPDPVLREVVLEEWQCRTKCKDVVLRALGLQERSVDRGGLPSVDCDARQGHAASVA